MMITDITDAIECVNSLIEYSSHEAVGKIPRFLRGDAQPEQFYRDLWATILSGRG